jgi:hypothetical protein
MSQGNRTDRPLPDPSTPIPTIGKTIGGAVERATKKREYGDELTSQDMRLLLRIAGAKPLYNKSRSNGHSPQ